MSMIKCPECGIEISNKAMYCPNCGCPSAYFNSNQSNIPLHNTDTKVSRMNNTNIHPSTNTSTHSSNNNKNNYIKIGLIVFAIAIVIFIFDSIFSQNSDNSIVEDTPLDQSTELSTPTTTEDKIERPESDYLESVPTSSSIEEVEQPDKEFDSLSDAFKQGFEDNFEISEENEKNIDSIKENADEIWNDPDVQKAYEDYKESLKVLFGGN